MDKSNSFSDWLRHQTRGFTTWLGQLGIRLGLHPDAITIAGLLVVLIAAWFAAHGEFFLSGIALILGTPLDALDGAVARAMNRKNRFGALLDSTLDRYADGFMFFGIAYYYAAQNRLNEMSLAVLALIGAFAVSYVRARAEGLEIRSIKEGLFDRLVRTIIMIAMLLTNLVVPGLILLAIGNHITALQRILIVYRITRRDETK